MNEFEQESHGRSSQNRARFVLIKLKLFYLNRLVPNENHYMEKILECFHQTP